MTTIIKIIEGKLDVKLTLTSMINIRNLLLFEQQFGGLFSDSHDIDTTCIDRNLVVACLEIHPLCMSRDITDNSALLYWTLNDDVQSIGIDL